MEKTKNQETKKLKDEDTPKKGLGPIEFGWMLIIFGAIGFCIMFPPLTFLLAIIIGVAMLFFLKRK